MVSNLMKILTPTGYMTLNRGRIVSIDRIEKGARIIFIPLPYSEDPRHVDSVDSYEKVLETYFSGI